MMNSASKRGPNKTERYRRTRGVQVPPWCPASSPSNVRSTSIDKTHKSSQPNDARQPNLDIHGPLMVRNQSSQHAGRSGNDPSWKPKGKSIKFCSANLQKVRKGLTRATFPVSDGQTAGIDKLRTHRTQFVLIHPDHNGLPVLVFAVEASAFPKLTVFPN